MATTKTHRLALDTLEASIKTILINTGSTFADPSNYESGRLIRTTTLLKTHLPPALSRFHDALDELERELIRARAVLHRDLVDARAKSIAGTAPKIPTDVQPTGEIGEGDVQMVHDAHTSPDEDLVQKDSTLATAVAEPGAKESPHDNGITTQTSEMSNNDARLKFGQPLDKLEDDTATKPESETKQFADSKDQVKQVSPKDPNIGSNDAAPNQEPVQDELGSSDDNSTPNDLFQDSIFGTPASNNELSPNEGSLSNVDVNSLLPGLEFYANDNSAEGGFDGLANLTTGDRTDFFAAGAMNAGVDHTSQLPRDSNMNFDDFFSNFGGDSGGGGGASTTGGFGAGPAEQEDTNFDESFFNLDG